VRSQTGLATGLYRRLIAGDAGNLVFSPLCVCVGLAMTSAGARGRTRTQIARALHLAGDPRRVHRAFASLVARLADIERRGAVVLRTAVRLWPQAGYPLRREFLARLAADYRATASAVDYRRPEAARAEINQWVRERTAGRIPHLIGVGVLSADTRLVLTNAVHFRGAWATPFDRELTTAGPFWIAPNQAVSAPMMRRTAEFRYAEDDDVQVLELPYLDDLSMGVALPRERQGLATIERQLGAAAIGAWTQALRPRRVDATLPRFRIESAFSLRDRLQALGVTDAFDGGRANFSAMDGGTARLFLSDVIHRACLEVNEAGAEAAAATAVMARTRLAPPPPATFSADHPFAFWIRDTRTGSLGFFGRLRSPS
jgi:serpin B